MKQSGDVKKKILNMIFFALFFGWLALCVSLSLNVRALVYMRGSVLIVYDFISPGSDCCLSFLFRCSVDVAVDFRSHFASR